MLRAAGMRSAQRIADIVKLLDTIAPAERERIVGVVNSPPLRVALEAGRCAGARDADAQASTRRSSRRSCELRSATAGRSPSA